MLRSFTLVICEYEVNIKNMTDITFVSGTFLCIFEMKDVFYTTQVRDILYVQ